MNNNYHGIILNVSQVNQSIFNSLKIIGKLKVKNSNWILYKVEINPNDLDVITLILQENMNENKFYFHFYRNNELIIVFKNRIFKISTEKSTWSEAIEYGKSLAIPEKQLDFVPNRIEDETY